MARFYAAGPSGKIAYYEGGSWTSLPDVAGGSWAIISICVIAEDDIWVGLHKTLFNQKPTLVHWNGLSWTSYNLTFESDNDWGVTSIFAFATNSVFAVGSPISGTFNTPRLWKWSGSSWAALDSGSWANQKPKSVWGSADNDVYLVGDHFAAGDTMKRWNGSNVVAANVGLTADDVDMIGVYGTGPLDVWVLEAAQGFAGDVYQGVANNWNKERSIDPSHGIATPGRALHIGQSGNLWITGKNASDAHVHRRTPEDVWTTWNLSTIFSSAFTPLGIWEAPDGTVFVGTEGLSGQGALWNGSTWAKVTQWPAGAVKLNAIGSIGTDLTPPVLQNQNPAPSSSGNRGDVTQYMEIIDLLSGVVTSAVKIWFEGTLAWENNSVAAGWSGVRGTVTDGYSYTLDPDTPLPAGVTITVRVYAEDLIGNVLDTTYTFDTVAVAIDAVSPDTVDTPGGRILTIAGLFEKNTDLSVTLGGAPCYGGSGFGYLPMSTDGLTLKCAAPPLPKGTAGLLVNGAYDDFVITELEEFGPDDVANVAEFGSFVAQDGPWTLVGAPAEDDPLAGPNEGGAYLFYQDSTGAVVQAFHIVPSVREANSQFAYSGDIKGNVVAIGCPFKDEAGSDRGVLYVFEIEGSTPETSILTQKQKCMPASPADWEYVGYSCTVYDANTVIAGAPTRFDIPGVGSAYVFNKSGGTWGATEAQKISPSDGAVGDLFGTSIDSDDSVNRVIIGSPQHDSNKGKAYTYDNSSGTFGNEKILLAPDIGTNHFAGDRHGVAIVGTIGIVARNAAQIVDIFEWTTVWTRVGKITGPDSYFGSGIAAVSGLLLIGSRGYSSLQGRAFLYDISTPSAPILEETIVLSDGQNTDAFGFDVAIIAANRFCIGGPFRDTFGTNVGSAVLYSWFYEPTIEVVERNWPGQLFGSRKDHPPWAAVGAKRLELEDLE
jgi:hypothetical protein